MLRRNVWNNENTSSQNIRKQIIIYDVFFLFCFYSWSFNQRTRSSEILFEGSEEFCALPTFCIIPAQKALFELLSNGVPGLEIDLIKVGSLFIYSYCYANLCLLKPLIMLLVRVSLKYVYLVMWFPLHKLPNRLRLYNTPTAPLQTGTLPPNECPGYDTK